MQYNKDKKIKTEIKFSFFNLDKSDLSRTWLCRDRSWSSMADYSKSNQGYIGP